MDIAVKFPPTTSVYFLKDGSIQQASVHSVKIFIGPTGRVVINYLITYDNYTDPARMLNEDELFGSVNDLTTNLFKPSNNTTPID